MSDWKAYQQYLRSREWQNRRNQYIKDYGYECERCGSDTLIQVHHMDYNHEPGTEPDSSLMALCPECHAESHDDKHLTP